MEDKSISLPFLIIIERIIELIFSIKVIVPFSSFRTIVEFLICLYIFIKILLTIIIILL
jgi:hypothetical protein